MNEDFYHTPRHFKNQKKENKGVAPREISYAEKSEQCPAGSQCYQSLVQEASTGWLWIWGFPERFLELAGQ